MAITVVGSVAFDNITTPFGVANRVLGGSATYFSVAASFFTDVQLVAVVGEDFTDEDMKVFDGRRIDTSGLTRKEGEKTFFWRGEYGFDLNVATTKETQLNAFGSFEPNLPENFRNPDVLFLANILPELQYDVLKQAGKPRLVALDTMNLWIETRREALERVIREIDLLIVNEAEVRQFTGDANLVKGARSIQKLGPETIVIKRGEYGVLMVTGDHVFAAPAFPLESVFDPTGAGDTFAGGFLGYLASRKDFDGRELRRSIVFGTVLASFNVESFSLDRIRTISRDDIQARFLEFHRLTHFDHLDT